MCLLLWKEQEACTVYSPPAAETCQSPPGSGAPGLQDSWGSPDSPAHLVWSKACCFAARWLDRICSLPATLHPQALHLIRITCHVSYITWFLGVSCQPKKCDSYSLLCRSVTARSQDWMHLELTVLKVCVGLNSMCGVGHYSVLKLSFWFGSKIIREFMYLYFIRPVNKPRKPKKKNPDTGG